MADGNNDGPPPGYFIVFGALAYGVMWWKGISFSDIVYGKGRQSVKKQAKEAIAENKKYLIQRFGVVDQRLEDQMELFKLIKNELSQLRTDVSQMDKKIHEMERRVINLEFK